MIERMYTREELVIVAGLCGFKVKWHSGTLPLHPVRRGHEPYPNIWEPAKDDGDNYRVLVAVQACVAKHPKSWHEISQLEQARWIEMQEAFENGDPRNEVTMQRLRHAVMELAIIVGARMKSR